MTIEAKPFAFPAWFTIPFPSMLIWKVVATVARLKISTVDFESMFVD